MWKQLVEVGKMQHTSMAVGKPYSAFSERKYKNLLPKNNSFAVAMTLLIGVAIYVQPAAAAARKHERKAVRNDTDLFQHPGVLITQGQLDFMKAQCNSRSEPTYSMFKKAQAGPSGSLNYKAKGPPRNGIIKCGPYDNPDIGCSDDSQDSNAAYVQTLLWIITGNKKYANNVITLLNTYTRKLKGFTGHNAPLQAAWSGTKWVRAAEIIRYSQAGWAPNDIGAFEQLLMKVYVPLIYPGSQGNGNWELAMVESMINIAVFTKNRKLFDHAVSIWKERVPAYFYEFSIDGKRAVKPPRGRFFWYDQPIFNAQVSGIGQETCRDFAHMQMGMASAINAAETAMHHGVNLYDMQAARLIAAMEFHANFALGAKIPKYICGGHLNIIQSPTYEIGYAHFQSRMGKKMSKTLELITWHRKSLNTFEDFRVMSFEALTHGAPNK